MKTTDMKTKDLPEDILLDVFPHLPPLYMDFTLPMVCRSYRRLVGANIAKLPKHTVSIHNTTLLPNGALRSEYRIGWFTFDFGRKWAVLTKERLKNLLVNPRLGRISRVKIHENDASSEVFVDHLITAAGKVPLTTVAIAENFRKHCKRLVKNLKPACLELLSHDPCTLSASCSSQHYIFHFQLQLKDYFYYNYSTNLIFSAAHNQACGGGMRLVYHFSHICYAMEGGGMDGGNPSEYRCTHASKRVHDDENAAVHLATFIICRFQLLVGKKEFHFPEDLLLFCDKDDSTGVCKKSMEKEWEKARDESKPIYRLESRIAEEIPGHNYYRRLKGCTWEVRWMSNPRLSSATTDTGGKQYLRVMRKVGGSDNVALAVHFKVFDEAGKADWENLN